MPESLDAWLARLEQRHHSAIDLGLERVRSVWENLARPLPAKTLLTVAGTNGKGSTVSYLDFILRSCGLTCARYTSPHLLRFNERCLINGQEASDAELVSAFEQVEAALLGVSLSYFEFTTLAIFLLMQKANLDCAVLEVGLGGRLDAVNILDPDCAVIMPIGLDHQAYLGDSIEQIAAEKAGIMRAGRPVIIGDRNIPPVVLQHAQVLGAKVQQIGQDFEVRGPDGQRQLSVGEIEMEFPDPPLAGRHQIDNMAVAIAAIESLFDGLLGKSLYIP